MREQVIEMFKKGKSAYAIHINLGVGIKEVYHYIRESEELAQRHNEALKYKRSMKL